MADIMAFIEDDCYELEEKAEKIFDYITDLEAKLAESKNDYLLLEEQLENANEWSKDFQDKISFAVEQLRLLKSQIIEKRRLYKGKFSEFSNGINDALCDVEEEIDNQIKQLKKKIK